MDVLLSSWDGCAVLIVCRQILTEMGFDLHLESADIDEKQVGDRASCPSELVLEVAKAKAQALLDKLANTESPYRILLTG